MMRLLCNAENLTVPVNGASLDCARFGRGEKKLVLLPGLSLRDVKSSVQSLAYMYRIFAERYTVYVLDKKTAVSDPCTIQDLAGDTACAMEQLGIRAADVFGISQGGMIAMELAAGYPHLVGKLVLGVTAARTNQVLRSVVENWIRLAENDRFDILTADMVEKMYSEQYVKKYKLVLPLLAKVSKPKDTDRFIALAKSCLCCNAFQRLDKISCPTFVIGGKLDAVVTAEASEEIAQKLGCGLFLYPQLGHAAYEEAPDFNERVMRFLLQ